MLIAKLPAEYREPQIPHEITANGESDAVECVPKGRADQVFAEQSLNCRLEAEVSPQVVEVAHYELVIHFFAFLWVELGPHIRGSLFGGRFCLQRPHMIKVWIQNLICDRVSEWIECVHG